MSRRVDGSRAFVREAVALVVLVAATLVVAAGPAAAQSASVTHYCFKDNGRFDVTLMNPAGAPARTFEIELTGLAARTRTVQPGQTKSLSFTGRNDGKYILEVRTGGEAIERYAGTVACDPEASIVVDCLAGNGRIAVTVSNRSSQAAFYTVTITGLDPRTRIVAAEASTRFAVTGRPDRFFDVTVQRDGREILSEEVQVDCDPDVIVDDALGQDATGVVVSCALGLGRFDVQVYFEPDADLPAAMFFEVVTGRITPRTAVLTQGSTYDSVITGRNNGPHDVTVRANGSVYFSESVTVDC